MGGKKEHVYFEMKCGLRQGSVKSSFLSNVFTCIKVKDINENKKCEEEKGKRMENKTFVI